MLNGYNFSFMFFFFSVIECREEGCTRRCGGQGDVLAGITGTLSFWATEREKQ